MMVVTIIGIFMAILFILNYTFGVLSLVILLNTLRPRKMVVNFDDISKYILYASRYYYILI